MYIQSDLILAKNMRTLFLCFLFIFLQYCPAKSDYSTEGCQLPKDYCIIGAGPSGLQMGYFLKKANRDYVIFEKSGKPGSFFEKYPRHRKLISINKRHTGRTNKEFNFRHDWNSLISDDENFLFTKYSQDYFPHADELLKYLADFQLKLNIKVQFNTEISNLTYREGEMYSMNDQTNNSYICKSVFIATGISLPIQPSALSGDHLIENYDTVTIDPKDFDGQSVLVLGLGNSAFEMASSIYGQAAFVHVAGRGDSRLSWDTHYVGDIRGVNNELIDSYLLKSLDGVLNTGAPISLRHLGRHMNGKIHEEATKLPKGYTFNGNIEHAVHSVNDLFSNDRSSTRKGYDRIISCLGFKWNKALFHNSTIPLGSKIISNRQKDDDDDDDDNLAKTVEKKFPDISYDYESTQFRGMYFLGPLSHSLDFRKSAGGFIHGFRYTARALHTLLEWKNHGIPWPSRSKDISKLPYTLLKRANEGSGIYQMFANLGDVAIIDRKENTFIYLEEYPINLLAEFTDKTGHNFNPERNRLLVMTLEYGKEEEESKTSGFSSSSSEVEGLEVHYFLHPVFYFYNQLPSASDMKSRKANETLPKPTAIHHMLDDFGTEFDAPKSHVEPLRVFLEYYLNVDLGIFEQSSCLSHKLSANPNDLPRYCRKLAKVVWFGIQS